MFDDIAMLMMPRPRSCRLFEMFVSASLMPHLMSHALTLPYDFVMPLIFLFQRRRRYLRHII